MNPTPHKFIYASGPEGGVVFCERCGQVAYNTRTIISQLAILADQSKLPCPLPEPAKP